jgi:hypothetical protein
MKRHREAMVHLYNFSLSLSFIHYSIQEKLKKAREDAEKKDQQKK